MNLALGDDQQFFQETTRKFLEQEMPLTAVRALADDPAGFDRGWWARGCDLGWTSLLVAEADGGGSLGGEGVLDLVIVAEEMGRLVSPGPLAPTNVVADAVSRSGTPELRSAVLPGIIAGDVVGAWCGAGPGGGWDGTGGAVTARRDGAEFVLDGVSTPVEAAVRADELLVTARTAGGLTQFLVPAGTAGVAVEPLGSVDLVRRYATVRFDRVRVSDRGVVGDLDGADAAVERQLQLAIVAAVRGDGGRARPGGRVHARVPRRPQLVRTTAGVLPGDQAPLRRHEDVVEACHGVTELAARAVQDESPTPPRS